MCSDLVPKSANQQVLTDLERDSQIVVHDDLFLRAKHRNPEIATTSFPETKKPKHFCFGFFEIWINPDLA